MVVMICPVCIGAKGGKSTVKKHGTEQMKKWGKKGGRPKKKAQKKAQKKSPKKRR
jgi:general stress protein YciG